MSGLRAARALAGPLVREAVDDVPPFAVLLRVALRARQARVADVAVVALATAAAAALPAVRLGYAPAASRLRHCPCHACSRWYAAVPLLETAPGLGIVALQAGAGWALSAIREFERLRLRSCVGCF